MDVFKLFIVGLNEVVVMHIKIKQLKVNCLSTDNLQHLLLKQNS